jgi:hypothetical protein
MLEIYDWLIPDTTKVSMTSADWLLLTLSTYLHDLGLVVTSTEFHARESSGYRQHWAYLDSATDATSKDFKAELAKLSLEERERFLYQEYVRSKHAERIRHWLSPSPDPALGLDPNLTATLRELLGNLDRTFLQDLGLVCESHHRDDLGDTAKYPTDRPYGNHPDEASNVQYIAALLRTADLLHITRDRVPAISFRLISPSNPISQREWAKQQAVRTVRGKPARDAEGKVDRSAPMTEVEVHATFSEADGFFALQSYLSYASSQLAQTAEWCSTSCDQLGAPHEFPWRNVDSSQVQADGFIARPFKFEIDQHRILDLLTGHTLYNNTNVVVRELVQNALDAVRLKQLEKTQLEEPYTPAVNVVWDPVGSTLEVWDNGTGMTQEVVERNFLRAGSSRYQEDDFLKRYPQFSPISRIGIGVLSTFMVADEIEVLTCHPHEPQARKLSLRSVHGRYLIRLIEKHAEELPTALQPHGTFVRIKLRASASLADVRTLLW